MASHNRNPVYNMSAVLKETGVQADVLRAWELRYDMPKPQRTPGGHRLYSSYDIAVIKWLRARQSEGLTISRAVDLWKEISRAGRDPLVEFSPLTVQSTFSQTQQIELLRAGWLEACLAFDAARADDAINQAFAIYPVETVCFEILQKGIWEIGELWHASRVTVQQEHFATAIAVRRIETLITATPNATREFTILTGCPAGEWHNFPVLLLTLLLRRRGLNVLYLGANIPIEQIEHTAAITHPALIVLSAQQLTTAASIRSVALVFRQLGIPLAYGGLIFNRIPQLRERIPALFLGESLKEAVEMVERLLTSPESISTAVADDGPYLGIAKLLSNKTPFIEARLMAILGEAGFPANYMVDVNQYFTSRLIAALELGSLDFLTPDLMWVKKLLKDRRIPPERLTDYMTIYQQALTGELGEEGALITEWIANYLSSAGKDQ